MLLGFPLPSWKMSLGDAVQGDAGRCGAGHGGAGRCGGLLCMVQVLALQGAAGRCWAVLGRAAGQPSWKILVGRETQLKNPGG